MKYSLFALFLVIGIAHGFLGPIGQVIDNVGGIGGQIPDKIKEEIDNAKTGIESITNGIQFAAKFLWDVVFSPAFDLLIQGKVYRIELIFMIHFVFCTGGQLILDNSSGLIGSMGNETTTVPENPFSDKYAQLVARFKTNVHTMYEQLFLIEQEAMKAIAKGEMNFEERIRAFHDKINAIEKQVNEWAAEMKAELEVFALTISGDWENIVNQYKQNIDSSVQSITKMFEQLTESLMKIFS